MNIKTKISMAIASFLAMLPIVSAYVGGAQISMMNFWDLFVVNIFGSFWAAVVFIALIFFIILMLGGISFYTVIIFEAYFLLAMSLGYGYVFFAFPILFISVLYLVWQGIKLIFENR